jgi:hypothetical protein
MAWRARRGRRKVASKAVFQVRIQTLDSAPASLAFVTKKQCNRTSDCLTEAMLHAPDCRRRGTTVLKDHISFPFRVFALSECFSIAIINCVPHASGTGVVSFG